MSTLISSMIYIKETLDSFLNNKQVQLSAERALHIVIEILLDLGNFLINKLKLPKPSTYSEIFKILCENNVLPRDLKDTLIDMARFRNLLVHGYAKIDATRAYYI
ncbi:MAG: type VII toxin-antitoxin system HepT family RNase toxin [Candidatus Asgardarchaeia archaeon]